MKFVSVSSTLAHETFTLTQVPHSLTLVPHTLTLVPHTPHWYLTPHTGTLHSHTGTSHPHTSTSHPHTGTSHPHTGTSPPHSGTSLDPLWSALLMMVMCSALSSPVLSAFRHTSSAKRMSPSPAPCWRSRTIQYKCRPYLYNT